MTRTDPAFAGHHNLAFELANDKNFDARHGTLTELIAEISAQTTSTVCVSSEEIGCLITKPTGARRLSDALKAVGFAVHPIVYLRPQADYIESLYAEISREWPLTLAEFITRVMTNEAFVDAQFDYFHLLAQIEETFEPAEVHVRAYDRKTPTSAIISDFLKIICADRHHIDVAALHLPGRLNQSLTFDDVLESNERVFGVPNNARANLRGGVGAARAVPFEPLALADLTEICLRFLPSNDQVRRRYGVRIGAVSSARLLRELIRAAVGDPAIDLRRRKIWRSRTDLQASA